MARRPLKPNTQGGRLIRVLISAWPGYAGGPIEFGNDFHTARNRMGDTLKPRGFRTVSQQREGYPWWEYRFETEEIYREAALLVRSWDLGLNARFPRAREAFGGSDSSGTVDSDSTRNEPARRLTAGSHPAESRPVSEGKLRDAGLRPTQAELELVREGGAYES
jgi:hypothetical protein